MSTLAVEIRAFRTLEQAEQNVNTSTDELLGNISKYGLVFFRQANSLSEIRKYVGEFSMQGFAMNYVLVKNNIVHRYTRQLEEAKKFLES